MAEDPLMHAFRHTLERHNFNSGSGTGEKQTPLARWIGLIILVLLVNLLTGEQQGNLVKGVISAIAPDHPTMPAPTQWVARNGKAYRVQGYAPLNRPAGAYPGQNYAGSGYPAPPYYGPRGY